jgi:hypothetical protein
MSPLKELQKYFDDLTLPVPPNAFNSEVRAMIEARRAELRK